MMQLSARGSFDFASAEYLDLLATAGATAFQHPCWLQPFYRRLPPANGVEPLIVLGHDRETGRLDLVLPLVRHADGSVEYAFLGVTDYACVVARPGAIAADPGLAAKLRETIGPHPLSVGPVRAEHAPQWRELLGVAPARLSFHAHALPIAGGAGSHFSSRRLGDLRRKRRQLASPLELKSLTGPAVREAFLQAQSWRRGLFSDDPLQTGHGLDFYVDVANGGARHGFADTFSLSAGGRTIAVLFGLRDGRSFRYLVLACDYKACGPSSPGLQVFDAAIAHWASLGGEEFDFTIGDEPYKGELGCVAAPMYGFKLAG
jgi:CelD/BcsL family acetyltransferase involved in cellulose biosynthesis